MLPVHYEIVNLLEEGPEDEVLDKQEDDITVTPTEACFFDGGYRQRKSIVTQAHSGGMLSEGEL